MARRADTFDLTALRLSAGEGRRLALDVPVAGLDLGGESYAVEPATVPVTLDVSRTTQRGWSLRLRFEVELNGPCMRCLEDAAPRFAIDAREVEQPSGGEELDSPYVAEEQLDLGAWTRDALALALPAQLLCRPDCAGLCPVCGENLNAAGPGHRHERALDRRWAKLRELEL
jgi:uncharacterized protein